MTKMARITGRYHAVMLAQNRALDLDLIDASARMRGLLTDEEIDTLFSRSPSLARPVDFE